MIGAIAAHFVASDMNYASTVLSDAPLAFYKLDETSGSTATDSSGNGRHGSYNGTITYRDTGPSTALPYAAVTSGASSWVGIPALAGLGSGQPQTWEIWYYAPAEVNASSAAGYLIGTQGGDNAYPLLLGSSTGNLTNEVVNIGTVDTGGTFGARTGWTSPLTIAAGWHHLVVAYNGTRNGWRLYIDGVEVTTGKVSWAASGTAGAAGMFSAAIPTIGRYATNYSAVRVAGAAVYASELSAARVAAHYAARNVT